MGTKGTSAKHQLQAKIVGALPKASYIFLANDSYLLLTYLLISLKSYS